MSRNRSETKDSAPPWLDWRFEVVPRAIPTPGGKAMTTAMRSRKVRRILRLEAQADRQSTREARATARARLLQRRVDALRTEVRAIEASLNGVQRAELHGARGHAAVPSATARPPRCPLMQDDPTPDHAEPSDCREEI